jgi:hypothetical protein
MASLSPVVLAEKPSGAQTALLLLLFESGTLARCFPAIPLAHGSLLSLSLVHPRLSARGDFVRRLRTTF